MITHRTVVERLVGPGCGLGPQHMVHTVIGAIGGVGEAIAIHIIGGKIGPVIAAPVFGPLDPFDRDVFHLYPVPGERVANDAVAFAASDKVDANAASLEPVIGEFASHRDLLYGVLLSAAPAQAFEHARPPDEPGPHPGD